MDVRIYYEDTDAAGVVYHANYLKFFERARTEYFREKGWLVAELASDGFVFPVVRIEIDFMSPALHDDLLDIITFPERVGGSSFAMRQRIKRKRDGKQLVGALVTLACIGPQLKARRIPQEIRRMLETDMVMLSSREETQENNDSNTPRT
jgi:acyl-CoA thioester hydrolase